MLWRVEHNFQRRDSIQDNGNGRNAVQLAVFYGVDDPQNILQKTVIFKFSDGAIQIILVARDANALNALKIAMGPVHFMRSARSDEYFKLNLRTQDKPLMAVFFKKLVENQPEFAPHAASLQAIIDIDPLSANHYQLPTWFKEPVIHYDGWQSTTCYSGNEASRVKEVSFEWTDDHFSVSLVTDNDEYCTRLGNELIENRAFPTGTIDHIYDSPNIHIKTSDKRLLRFFMQKLVEAQPDFSDTATELLAQMDSSHVTPYSMAEIEHMYPAAQPPASIEMQRNLYASNIALMYGMMGSMQRNLYAANIALMYGMMGSWSTPLRPMLMHMPSEQPLLLSRTTTAESRAEQNFLDENADVHMICPITNTLMTEPVYAKDSGSDRCFEKAAIEQWIQSSSQINSEGVQVARHPLTDTSISMSMLVSNEALKTAIETYKANANKLAMK